MVTDLPNELMSALSQGLSQFGINLPAMPTGLLGRLQLQCRHADDVDLPGALASPGLTSPALTPGLASPRSPRPDHARLAPTRQPLPIRHLPTPG